MDYKIPLERSSFKPTVVTLCGSTRFKDKFVEHMLKETLAGKIVLTIGCDLRTDTELLGHLESEELLKVKAHLDRLHLYKIDMSDEILVLNVGGYIGESTRNEIEHAKIRGKRIRYIE